jgi:hypothetical protein
VDLLRDILASPLFLVPWAALVVLSVAFLVADLRRENPEIARLMKWVWIFTVAYSGPLGLAVYAYSGRKQMARDSLARRAFRSTAHCYSGCGAGEIAGVVIAAGILELPTLGIAALTFTLAYVAGFALTVGPLVQEGMAWSQALWDAAVSETASITVMEVVAIGVDLLLAGEAGLGDALFWASLVFSLSMGFLAAFPVNVLLVRLGVKEGMHSPKEHAAHGAS